MPAAARTSACSGPGSHAGLAYDTEAIGLDTIQRHIQDFSRPGAMRAGFELYRAFPTDAEHNRAALERNGRLRLPVLAMAGAHSAFKAFTEGMMREVAEDVTFRAIARTNHWIPEENPEDLAEALLAFLGPD